MQNLKVEPSEQLAYWVGVAQSDGCITRYKIDDKIREELTFGVCEASLPMLKEFQKLSFKLFNRHSNIWKTNGRDEWKYHIGVKKLKIIFQELDIMISPIFLPPKWVLKDKRFFGAYLAGLIDGDGDIRIKRKKSLECLIRLTSGIYQNFLEENIEKILSIGVSQNERFRKRFLKSEARFIEGKSVELEFCISSKNYEFVVNFVVPHLRLHYKKEKILEYFKMRWPGFEPGFSG